MRKALPFLICLFLWFVSCSSDRDLIEPTSNFSMNFCNFPHAWTVSRGTGVNVGVIFKPTEDSTDWGKLIQRLAPESSIKVFDKASFLNPSEPHFDCHLFFLAEPLTKEEYGSALDIIKDCQKNEISFILPSQFGPMTRIIEDKTWFDFVLEASALGAIIVGTHGRTYQLGNIDFWKNMPIDIFALSRRVDGDRLFGTLSNIENSGLEESSYLAAGAAALLKSQNPQLKPAEIKKIFQERGRQVIWMIPNIPFGDKENSFRAWPLLNQNQLRQRESALQKGGYKILEVFEGNCLDAALLLDLDPMGDREWSSQVLRAREAHKLATGKGVIVAILDHQFDDQDPSLEGRLIKPGSVLEGAPVFDPKTSSGHGTWMARDLVHIAPDVKIMPVRFCGRGQYGDPDLYIKGIEYAVENGAHIVSISHQPIPEKRQADFDLAIARAADQGVTVVYIHYQGERKDVVVTKPIEFAPFYKGEEHVYVIGTNSINESSFPYTWGFSQTAPYVAGVIALMKEVNPGLKPAEIREILLNSGRLISNDFSILDAFAAVKNSKELSST